MDGKFNSKRIYLEQSIPLFELLRTGLASKFIKRAIMTFDTQFDADFKSVSGKKVT